METDGGGWMLVYETLSATRDNAGSIIYDTNNSTFLQTYSFTRVAYRMQNNMLNQGTLTMHSRRLMLGAPPSVLTAFQASLIHL
jgi:hypothetical protein